MLQSLVLFADLDRGLERIEAWVQGPPERPSEIRAMTWDYIGVRNYRARRYPESTAAFARAVELAPSPRLVLQWATSAEMARDDVSSKRAFTLLLERAPDDFELRLTALVALARFARDEGDRESFSNYTRQAVEMAPQLPLVRELARQLDEDTGGHPPQ
jgi:Tfp pilus assembly protein PilF